MKITMDFEMYSDKEQFEIYYKAIEYKSLLQEILKTIKKYYEDDQGLTARNLASDVRNLIIEANIEENLNL